ncbi:MAG: pre-peptidase C-terminal domain-containing protein [Deltaproteobacteria bacterium]|nr:pre-peptidase C-terminal domain-containing protein [Deltaproteobacteria bacterium]
MKTNRQKIKQFISGLIVSCAMGFFIVTLPSIADGEMDVGDASPLFTAVQRYTALDASDDAPDDPTIIRQRFVNINLNVLETTGNSSANEVKKLTGNNVKKLAGNDVKKPTGIKLNLFDDSTFTANVDRVETDSQDSYALVGRIEEESISSVILVVGQDGTLTGNITIYDMFFQVRYAGDGTHVIREIDQTAFPEGAESVVIDESRDTSFEDKADQLDFEQMDSGSIIDVMVVYTPDARFAAEGEAAMHRLIDLAVLETNIGYSYSGIHQRLRLVHTEEVNYSESEFDMGETLKRLQLKNDRYMDNVHTLRDTYAADCVVLITESGNYCGIAYVMKTVDHAFESGAFSLVKRGCATSKYAFAHELGHNMGSVHDYDNAINVPKGAYPYSYGYQAPDESFHTIMAYDCPGGCRPINYWSNPDVNYNGQPTGVDHTAYSAADNRRSLNNTALTVANFRTSLFKKPVITNPVPGTILSGATQTFCWTADGVSVTNWLLHVGSRRGARDIYNSGGLGTATCDTVSGLPTDGSIVYVRLYYRGDGSWGYIDETYTGGDTPEITTDLSAAKSEWLYYDVNVPEGASNLTVTISGGTGDVDLYTRFGAEPTKDDYDCGSWEWDNNETCTHAAPEAGVWYIGVHAFSAFSGVSLTVEYY